MKRQFLTVLSFLLWGFTSVVMRGQQAQQSKTIDDAEINVTSLAEMKYPLAARLKRTEGIVVVRVEFDDDGRVVSSQAISGPKDFISDALSNAKKWRFHGTKTAKTAIIIYDFRIDGFCREGSHFTFRAPNVALITGCYLAPPPISPD